MRIALDALPTDTNALQQLVRDLAGALGEGQTEIDRLRLIIRQFQRVQFGRRSEQLDPDQMALGLVDLEADLAPAEARRPVATPNDGNAPEAPDKPPHRAPLPAHLPRAETVIPVPCDACPECGGALHDAGATSSEMLDWVPASIRVVRITRPKKACRCCGTLHQAPAPERTLAGGLAAPGLIAHVLVSRYCDHLPLYRQSQIFARHGLEISRSTLSGSVGAACWWLEALHDRLVSHVMSGDRVFADDTPLPVLDPAGVACSHLAISPARPVRQRPGPASPAPVGPLACQQRSPTHQSTAPSAQTLAQDPRKTVQHGPDRPSGGETQVNMAGEFWASRTPLLKASGCPRKRVNSDPNLRRRRWASGVL